MRCGEGKPVCVLGAGRSGTSLVAEVIASFGIDLGPQESMHGADDGNPRGYWEHRKINELNDAVLARLGGDVLNPPLSDPGWERAPEMAAARSGVQELVADTFRRGGRWAFKDPRTVLTLPLWRSAVGEFDFVICVRNPLEVRASAADVVTAELRSGCLWAYFNCEALRQTAESRRTFVFYEDWFRDPARVSGDLARFLCEPSDDLGCEASKRAESIVDAGLHRNQATDIDLARTDDLAPEVRALHLLIRDLADAEARGDVERAQVLQAVATSLDGRWVEGEGDAHWF